MFDLLSGTNPTNLEKAMPGRTVALVSSSKVPTGAMVRDTSAEYPEWSALQSTIDSATVPEKNVYYDAGNLSDNLFRSHMPANIIVLGSAYQSGVVPISASAIERAIELNGVAVEMNTQAFRIGRQIVLEPDFLDALDIERVGKVGREAKVSAAVETLVQMVPSPSEELERLLKIRAADLIDYQSGGYARTYVERVAKVRSAEASMGQDTRLSETYARYLYKLMAYKDEYEVARLHRSKEFHRAVQEQFGDASKVTYKLHPPSMRRLGMDQKIGLGRSGDLAFALLLAFLAYPAFRTSPRDRVPLLDWGLALVGAFAASYMYVFYEQLAQRPGAPILQDVIIGVIGLLLLQDLELPYQQLLMNDPHQLNTVLTRDVVPAH